VDPGTAPDGADAALVQLVEALGRVAEELWLAQRRALELQEQRTQGRNWYDIVSAEERPLIVEQVSSAMASLSTVGGQWRREQATALARENVSINRIAALYGVTRQRVSAILRGRVGDPDADDPDPVE
jgi:plasmid maintenance system antidote protein VapI